ncbi:hypothetical protein TrST_g13887 [Triparma strigata]|uniref:Uncharacterized protein n=1 Tax=Triparma strigata TaxID=1606541 RepID=A0A9W7EZH4_9STRA|nr:hypothetical protein TrST_g13887 [Triparma strigata]
MSKRTSEDSSNAIEIPDPNNYNSGGDEEDVFEGSELDSPAAETPVGGGDDFMHTDDFRRLFVGFVMVDTLVAMRWLDKNGTNIPEGITNIGYAYFYCCSSLKEIKFPKSLTSIGEASFQSCSSLEQVDLLHTKVQELGDYAFYFCTSLREVKIPDSLQTFGYDVFCKCSNLVPSDIGIGYGHDVSKVVAYLRSIQ